VERRPFAVDIGVRKTVDVCAPKVFHGSPRYMDSIKRLDTIRWGLTPGKWIVGIRVVGTDLQPCGFGRALLRNFLKMVDGFYNFMVGILIVTFTKDWQRVGDMAARTIVIRKTPVAESQMTAD